MRNAGLEEPQAGIKIAGRNINNLRYADDTTLAAESKELKSLLVKVKEESKTVGLKLTFRKLRSWHLVPSLHGKYRRKQWKQCQIFGGSKITADGNCSHEIKRRLLLGRSYEQLRQHIKKQRHYLANKGPSSQGYSFSNGHVWM